MHLKPKKSLGQNFLVDKNIQGKIIAACELKPDDTVLEIGAGRGELTRLLVSRAALVYALEIDRGLCAILRDNLKGCGNLKIINRDILKFSLSRYFSRCEKKIKVIGNIPYYITTPILARLFAFRDKIDAAFLTVQKEFAVRAAASPGSKDCGALSCFVRYYSEPKIIFSIKKGSFSPAPKVDSSLLCLKMRARVEKEGREEKNLFRIIRAAFGKRRKTLRNSLKGVVGQERLDAFFKKFYIDCDIRPERLRLKDFINLLETKA